MYAITENITTTMHDDHDTTTTDKMQIGQIFPRLLQINHEKLLGITVLQQLFLQARCSYCQPTNSVKALKESHKK